MKNQLTNLNQFDTFLTLILGGNKNMSLLNSSL